MMKIGFKGKLPARSFTLSGILMSSWKAYILYRYAETTAVYDGWLKELPLAWEIVEDFLPDWVAPDDAGILITHSHYAWEDLTALRGLYAANQIPILILCDGILEYRNTWAHPQLANGSLFQPTFGHKLACLGRAPARILESWGNVGKCEVVGLPRLDRFVTSTPPPIRTDGTFRLLVTTAMRPSFTDQQMDITVASIGALKSRLEASPRIGARPVEVNWRLTGGVASKVGLPEISLENAPALMEMIDQSDAVITTPSTIYLESVLRKRPTAFLDFHNCPQYVNAAWNISAESQIDVVLAELADPPPAKMLYQATMLHDQLECMTPAQDRMIRLIQAMVDLRRQSAATRTALKLPARILTDERYGMMPVPREFQLAGLYENQSAFESQEAARLRIELDAAIKLLGSLPLELNERQLHIERVNRLLDEAKYRNRDMLFRLNKAEQELEWATRKSSGAESNQP
jgi:hypothetical protein